MGSNRRAQEGGPNERDRDLDRVFAALADGSRRRTLRTLREAGGPIAVEELARRVVDPGADESREAAVERLLVPLRHVHLPKLREAGLVEYDPDRGTVAPTEELAAVRPLLAAAGSP